MTDASMTVGHDSADTARIASAGEIDMANATRSSSRSSSAIDNQLTAVTIDLAGSSTSTAPASVCCSPSGNRLDILQIALRLVVPTGSSIRRVIDLSGMAAAIPVLSH